MSGDTSPIVRDVRFEETDVPQMCSSTALQAEDNKKKRYLEMIHTLQISSLSAVEVNITRPRCVHAHSCVCVCVCAHMCVSLCESVCVYVCALCDD